MKAANLCMVLGLILFSILQSHNVKARSLNCLYECKYGISGRCDCNNIRSLLRRGATKRSSIRVPFRYGKRSDLDYLQQYRYGNNPGPAAYRQNNYEEALDLLRNALYDDY